jgi:hypothetical protein
MKKARLFLILGIWIAVLPYLGFPSSWRSILETLSGLVLMYYSYLFYKEHQAVKKKEKTFDNFSDNI